MKLSTYLERTAQRLFNLRDSVRATDFKTWASLNTIATDLSILAGELKEKGL